MMYTSPIIVKRNPQKVRYNRQVKLDDDILTLAILHKHVTEDEVFTLHDDKESIFSYTTILSISGNRLETTEELAARIEKEEAYNIKYKEFHERHKRK